MGVLIDTSVWVDYFRFGNRALPGLLQHDAVLIHPLVVGELACGTPPALRAKTLSDLELLQACHQAGLHEVMGFVERERLDGLGCGLIDLSLLASVLPTPDARLWTLDKRLAALAARFNVGFEPVHRGAAC